MIDFNNLVFCKKYPNLVNLKFMEFMEMCKTIDSKEYLDFIKKIKEFLKEDDFDFEYYRKNNLDLHNLSFIELIYHYKNYGKIEGRFCSEKKVKDFLKEEDFNVDFYRYINKDLVNLSNNELIYHYKNFGKSEGRIYSKKQLQDFDIELYKKLYDDLKNLNNIELISHYKKYGKNEKRICSEKQMRDFVNDDNFDIEFYKNYNPELSNFNYIYLLYHYKNIGKKNGMLILRIKEFVEDNDFDISFLKKNYKFFIDMSLENILNYYKYYANEECLFGSEKQVREFVKDDNFDIEFYRKYNSDLNAFSFNELIHHYKNYGKNEGRFGSEKQIRDFVEDDNFDIDFYIKYNSDLTTLSFIELIHHYKNYGKNEGRFGSEKQIRVFVGDDNFDIEFYKKYNSDLTSLSFLELINHYKNYGKNDARISSEQHMKYLLNDNNFNFIEYKNSKPELKELNTIDIMYDYIISCKNNYRDHKKILFIKNNISSHMIEEIPKKNYYLSEFDINIINSFILIIDFPDLGGGTTKFLDNIINKYKYYQPFIIIRKKINENNIEIIMNNEIILKYNNKYYFEEEECKNFLKENKSKISKIFINHILGHSDKFICDLNNLKKEITFITHDYFSLYKIPQTEHIEIITKKNIRENILINNFDNIIIQDIGNLNIYGQHIESKKNIIVTELPDFKNTLKKYITNNNNQIIIGVIGYINRIKGSEIINELNTYINSNNLNMKIIIFGNIEYKNIETNYYNSIENLNELLIKHQPNILLETSIWQETYSYTLTLSMITKLPILSYFKNYKYVINNRLKNYDKSYFFKNIDECVNLINQCKQDFFYTIEPVIYYNSFWDNYFMRDSKSVENLEKFNSIISEIDYDINHKIHDKIEPYAIYFPQFHRIPENDILFYKGYTDMENFFKSKYDNKLSNNILTPLKGVLDNYDIISNDTLINSQINLAKRFGIKGFAIYHYWFDYNLFYQDRNNVMEDFTQKIIDIDDDEFSYFLIWANEKWCDQLYNIYEYDENLIDKHFNNLIKYFNDKKYKKVDGKPVLSILHYYWWSKENFNKYVSYLNKKCIENGFNGIYISAIAHHAIAENIGLLTQRDADAYYINVPSWKNASMFGDVCFKNNTSYVDYKYYVNNFEVDIVNKIKKDKDVIFNIFPNFDNYVRNYFKETMRRFTYENCSVDNFEKYFIKILKLSKEYKNNSKILLINSWNEWGENMAIEPSNELNYKYLEIIYDNLKKYLKY